MLSSYAIYCVGPRSDMSCQVLRWLSYTYALRHAKSCVDLEKLWIWIIWTVNDGENFSYCSMLTAKIKIIGTFSPSEGIRIQPELAPGFTFKVPRRTGSK